jgi:hypothetical protein
MLQCSQQASYMKLNKLGTSIRNPLLNVAVQSAGTLYVTAQQARRRCQIVSNTLQHVAVQSGLAVPYCTHKKASISLFSLKWINSTAHK